MTIPSGDKRFHDGAQKYAAYLQTPEGRLRADLALANVEDFLSASETREPLHALDIGSGTGAAAVGLARLGFQVTALDSSAAMLAMAKRTAEEAGVANRITLRDATLCNCRPCSRPHPSTWFFATTCSNISKTR
jgi:ubiquinone/menaquinone biosynthesis C-methylase UbiE